MWSKWWIIIEDISDDITTDLENCLQLNWFLLDLAYGHILSILMTTIVTSLPHDYLLCSCAVVFNPAAPSSSPYANSISETYFFPITFCNLQVHRPHLKLRACLQLVYTALVETFPKFVYLVLILFSLLWMLQ